MSKKCIIFLDIDGTLVNTSANPEFIPESAVKAVRQARANGHQIYLCTGRSKAEIYDFITEVGFDGVIGAAGGFIEVQGKEIFHEAMEKKKEGSHFINALIQDSGMPMEDINKICFLETNGSRYQDIYDTFHDKFYMVRCTVPMFGDESGEMSVPGINKSTSIRILLDYHVSKFGARGDGTANDAPSIQKAIDACSQAGGGRVILESGKHFYASSIILKAKVDLHIERGAVLQAHADIHTYFRKGRR